MILKNLFFGHHVFVNCGGKQFVINVLRAIARINSLGQLRPLQVTLFLTSDAGDKTPTRLILATGKLPFHAGITTSTPLLLCLRGTYFSGRSGLLFCPFHAPTFIDNVGYQLSIRQTNLSPTRRGAVPRSPFADVPPGQAKYVYAAHGRLLDVLVDLRVGSPTFSQYVAIELSLESGTAVFLPEGIGHLVIGLTDDAALSYLCSEAYNPPAEHGINPLDPALGLPFHDWCDNYDLGDPDALILSPKDKSAPTLAAAQESRLLPRYDECVAFYNGLRRTSSESSAR
ncbi:MAG: dTDP-4-dehydrorhamnose 3,5-epimerase [Lawsonella clevelandensis]